MVKSMEPPANHVLLSVFGHTDVGMQRSGNEDSFLIADLTTGKIQDGVEANAQAIGSKGALLVVSDGMGGAVAGEIASELAVTTVKESLLEMPLDFQAPDKLRTSAEVANERIWNHARQNPELTGMGATLTAVLVQDTVAYIAQVGDSRAYLVRGERIKQLTKDQSLVQMLLDSGAITPEQAASVPQNVIMQALGTQPQVKVAMSAVKLCKNDHLLLCSDGLSNKIRAEEMSEVVKQATNLTAACSHLIETANGRGGEDNITVIIAKFDGAALHSASESNTITGSFLAITDPAEEIIGQSDVVTAPLGSEPPAASDDDIISEDLSAFADAASISYPATQRLDASALSGLDEAPTTRLSNPMMEGEADGAEPITTARITPQRKSYAPIALFTLLALALVAAAAYFYYLYFLKARPAPTPAPVVEEQQSQTPDDEQKPPPSGQPDSQPTTPTESQPETTAPASPSVPPQSTPEAKPPSENPDKASGEPGAEGSKPANSNTSNQ